MSEPSYKRDKGTILELQDRVESLKCTELLMPNMQSLGHGTYNDAFTVDLYGRPAVLRVSYYSPSTLSSIGKMLQSQGQDYQNAKRQAWRLIQRDSVSIKNNFGKITNFFVEQDICPHFAYNFGNKNCKKIYERIKHMIPAKTTRKLSEESQRYNNVSLSELFDTDMWKTFKRIRDGLFRFPESELRSVIFQTLYSLATLQHFIPGFRHNDISLANVLLKWTNTPGTYVYEIYGTKYRLANTSVFAAVHDFDFAHAEAHVIHMGGENVRIPLCNLSLMYDTFRTNKDPAIRRINRSPNPSFDSNIFLYQVRKSLSDMQSTSRNTFVYYDTLNFLQSLGITENYQERPNPSLNPATLLKHPYFASMRTNSPRVDFSVRSNTPFEVYVGPRACSSNIQVSEGTRTEYVRSNDVVVLPWAYPAQEEPDPTLFRYGYEDMMTDFDAALIMKSCDDLDTKVLSILKKRFGAVSCEQLRDIVRQRYADNVEDEVGQLVTNCSAFFTRKELLEFAKRAAPPGVDLRYKTKGQLCDLVQVQVLGKVVKPYS
jgi:hypothetical protein